MQCFCFAEYCAGPFYMGWWLYERQTNDGRPNNGDLQRWDSGWGWMQDTSSCSPQQQLHDLCRKMGYEPPLVKRYRQNFAEWFAGIFPNGIRVQCKDEDTPYELIDIVQKRPRQKPGVIRTLRGAAMADRRNAEREEAERKEPE